MSNLKWADPEAVQSAAEEWSDKVVECRTYGHNWASSSVARTLNGFAVRQKCRRCSNVREQDMDSRGYAQPWRYIYREGYLSQGLGRIDHDGRAVLRLAAIRHVKILEPEL